MTQPTTTNSDAWKICTKELNRQRTEIMMWVNGHIVSNQMFRVLPGPACLPETQAWAKVLVEGWHAEQHDEQVWAEEIAEDCEMEWDQSLCKTCYGKRGEGDLTLVFSQWFDFCLFWKRVILFCWLMVDYFLRWGHGSVIQALLHWQCQRWRERTDRWRCWLCFFIRLKLSNYHRLIWFSHWQRPSEDLLS